MNKLIADIRTALLDAIASDIEAATKPRSPDQPTRLELSHVSQVLSVGQFTSALNDARADIEARQERRRAAEAALPEWVARQREAIENAELEPIDVTDDSMVVEGRLKARETRAPLPAAELWLLVNGRDTPLAKTRTDPWGRYRFRVGATASKALAHNGGEVRVIGQGDHRGNDIVSRKVVAELGKTSRVDLKARSEDLPASHRRTRPRSPQRRRPT